MTVPRIIVGDCRNVLRTLPADSVHCVVTSPPYWGLRDYGVSGQLGLEPTFTEFIDKMVEVFREVRRVLRPDGTLWLNLGDSYTSAGGGGEARMVELHGERDTDFRRGTVEQGRSGKRPFASVGLKPKDLCGIPWRVALALQADGWWLRQDIIWSKPNPMPESVTDRCTKAHEYLFLLSKSARYFYDAEAIKEISVEPLRAREAGNGESAVDRKTRGFDNCMGNTGSRNRHSVWEIATSPFPEAHFATFPPALVEPCIKAGTSEKGCCSKCGAPWERQVEKIKRGDWLKGKTDEVRFSSGNTRNQAGGQKEWDSYVPAKTLGWSPTCTCQAPVIPCTVLDPFGGAGTTGLVADRLQRNAVLIELNPTYAAMAEQRIFSDAPLFYGNGGKDEKNQQIVGICSHAWR
ncbi:MAG TPA: site-specific DNA-methyltransferase [Candidatus Acidoferrum sp.]